MTDFDFYVAGIAVLWMVAMFFIARERKPSVPINQEEEDLWWWSIK